MSVTPRPTLGSIPGFSFAMVGTVRVTPQIYPALYHGTCEISPSDCDEMDGLPGKGSDIDLIRHAEPPAVREIESAFRGTVHFPLLPTVSAAEWAGEGG